MNPKDEVELIAETHDEAFARWWNSLGETIPHNASALAEMAFIAGRATPPTPVSTTPVATRTNGCHVAYHGRCKRCDLQVEDWPASELCPNAPASPLTVPACVLCGHNNVVNGRCVSESRNAPGLRCGCKCELLPTAQGDAEVPAGFGESCFCGVKDREHGFGPRCVDWPKRCLCGMGAMAAKLVTAGGLKSYRVECTRERCWSGPERETVREACRAWNALSTTTAPTPVEDEKLREIRERLARITGQFISVRSDFNPDDAFLACAPSDIDYLLTRLSQAELNANERGLLDVYRQNLCGDAECEGSRFSATQTVLKGTKQHKEVAEIVHAAMTERSLNCHAAELFTSSRCRGRK